MSRAGNLITLDGQPALRFERRYRHPMARVWRAVTDPDEMARWFPAAVLGDRAVGAELVFDDDAQRQEAMEAGEPTRADGPMFRGRVVVWDPPRRFCFTWGDEELRLELAPDGDGTTLVFTQLLSHPSVAARNGAGWHACLAELDGLLGAEPPSGDWDGVYDDYLARMGPPLGEPDGDALVFERATHVEPARVRSAVDAPDERTTWGAPAEPGGEEAWDIDPRELGCQFTLRVAGAATDPELAAAWHARLVQLDLYLAAGVVHPSAAATWRPAYDAHLADRAAAPGR